RAVIPVANRAPETITAPPPEPETATVNGRGESTYVDFEESSVGPVIERVRSNGEKETAPEAAAFASSSVSDEPAVSYEQPVSDVPTLSYEPPVFDEPTVSYEPAVQQAEPESVAAFAEDTFPTEPVREWEVSEPVEAPASVFETHVFELAIAEVGAPSEVEEQISIQEWSPDAEPVEQGQPEPY